MSHTQTDINNAVNSVVNTYIGQRSSYHGLYAGECTVPAADYVEILTGSMVPSMYGNRADGWGVQFPAQLAPYFTHETFQPGKVYPFGTLLLWDSPHISIVFHSDGSNTVQVFEQNADPDGSPCHIASRVVNNSYHTCIYALVPIITADIPEPPALPYSISKDPTPDGKIFPRQMQLKKDAFRYNCTTNPTTDEGIDAKGLIFTAEGILTHVDGYPYYMPNINDPSGFLVQDCQDYVPPTPVPVPVQAPVQLATAAPAVTAPNTSATFVVKTNLNGYSSPGNALTSKPPVTMTFTPTTYYIYSSLNGMLNLTTKAGTPGAWVNPTLNVVVPPPPPAVSPLPTAVANPLPKVDNSWKSMTPLRSDRKPVEFVFETNYTIYDYGGQRPPLPTQSRGTRVLIYGTFTKNGVKYFRPRLDGDEGFQYWLGIPVKDNSGFSIIYPINPQEIEDKTFSYANKVTIADKLYVYAKTGEKWLDGIKKHF